MNTNDQPILIYDSDCDFCKMWVARWKQATREKVRYVPYQEVAAEFPEVPFSVFENAVQLIWPDGRRLEGAEAVFELLAMGGLIGRLLLKLYHSLPLFKKLSERSYQTVARHRRFSSLLTRSLWGGDVRPPTYNISSWMFLRGLAIVYLIAFYSFLVQQAGLIGSNGILPFANYFKQSYEAIGASAYYQLPSLLWFWPSDTGLAVISGMGLLLAVLAFFGVFPVVSFALSWVFYLSLVVAGQIFYAFQWDSLLLEIGFLAFFLAPVSRFAFKPATNTPKIARWLLIWLLFRFMLSSGIIKLSSGDPTWANLAALNYHFFTQPLPNILAWYAQLLPQWIKSSLVVGMFAIELVLPFFIFLPRRGRLIAFIGFVGLQLGIFATGNYGYFIPLNTVLCLLLIDDLQWKQIGLRIAECGLVANRASSFFEGIHARFISRRVALPIGVFIVLISLVPFFGVLRKPVKIVEPLTPVYRLLMPFRLVNGYGLFAIMTTTRLEIIVQGSRDGQDWQTYLFRFKPGPIDRSPREAWFYMPRLDWQMWFAALGHAQQNPWFFNFLQRLLEGSQQTLDLFEENPFGEVPPRYVRAFTDRYRFSTPEEKRATGAWWDKEPAAIYVPEASLGPN